MGITFNNRLESHRNKVNTAQTIIARYNGKWFHNGKHVDDCCKDIAKIAIHNSGRIEFIFQDGSCLLSATEGYSEKERELK